MSPSTERGLQMLRWAIGGVLTFLAAGGGWLVWKAIENPDVRLKKPRWVEGGFDHSYWIPVLVVVIGGAALVGWVLRRTYARLKSGEDLYEGRMGRGVRRRGEQFLDGP